MVMTPLSHPMKLYLLSLHNEATISANLMFIHSYDTPTETGLTVTSVFPIEAKNGISSIRQERQAIK